MAADDISAMTRLSDITECCICLKTFTDPRMLPCIHTFCFQCLENLTEKSDKKPGDTLPCPVCRKEFIIPNDGVQCIQKNFFMAGMVEVRNALNQAKVAVTPCHECNAKIGATEANLSQATLRCVDCQQNLCDDCCTMHKASEWSRHHKILKFGVTGVGLEEGVKTATAMNNCDVHPEKILDYYCVECKKVVCASCFLKSHRIHEYSEVAAVEEKFRKMIKVNADRISSLVGELLAKKEKSESKEHFLKKVARSEDIILKKSEDLKAVIDEHAKSLLSSLDEIKNRRLKEIQTKEDELERRITILESFSRYCDRLISKGSASEVCRNKDELQQRADELEEDHETYIMRPNDSFNVRFRTTDLKNFLKTSNGNMIGSLKEQNGSFEDFAVLIAASSTLRFDSFKINLNRPNEVSPVVDSASTKRTTFSAAAVYNNTVFITGFGEAFNEIWKYNFASGWMKCGTLVQERRYHCSEFIGDTLYICGGSGNYGIVLDSIESYNALTKKSAVVGQLEFGTESAACVAYKGSIYVFGGIGDDWKPLDCVQVFNPGQWACTLLSTPLACPSKWMRAVLWNTYAVLMSSCKCFIFDLEGKTWHERKQIEGDSYTRNNGMILHNNRLFIIDGGQDGNKGSVHYTRMASIVNDETPNWREYGQLPQPLKVIATAQLSFVKQSS